MIEYCTFSKSGIDDFRAVILPNIWEQLAVADSYEELGLQLIGALQDDEPVGALVAQFLENEEVTIDSLYVRSDCRLQGIGSTMLQQLCALAAERYPHAVSEDFPLLLHMEYALPAEDCGAFESFLQKQGFRDFLEKEPSYLFERSCIETALRKQESSTGNIFPLSAMESYDEAEFADYFEAAGFTADPAHCFLHCVGEEPDFLVSAMPGDENDFYLSSTTGGAEPDGKVCGDTVRALLRALCAEYADFELIVDGEINEALPLWEELAACGGSVYRRREAGMYAVFEA